MVGDTGPEIEHVGHLHGAGGELREWMAWIGAELERVPMPVPVRQIRQDGCVGLAADGGGFWLVGTHIPGGCAEHVLFNGLACLSLHTATVPRRKGHWPEALGRTVRELVRPFTASERARIGSLNPLLQEVASRHHGRIPPRVTVAIREHSLLEKINLVDALCHAGIDPEDVVFIPKDDSTLYRERVLGQLRQMGCRVLTGPWQSRLAELLPELRGRRLVTVDDGGKLIQALWRLLPDAPPWFTGIETTSKGRRRLRLEGLGDRVVDLSESPAKLGTSRAIAVSGVMALKREIAHRPQERSTCHVVGYGHIGSATADLLQACGFGVTISDPLPERRRAAAECGFAAYPGVREALTDQSHRYLLGCSGEPAVGVDDIAHLEDDAVVGSMSSNDLAPLLEQVGRAHRAVTPAGIRCSVGGREVLIMAGGHAINLHGSEGVPEPDFDPFMAAVAEAALAAASGDVAPHLPQTWATADIRVP